MTYYKVLLLFWFNHSKKEAKAEGSTIVFLVDLKTSICPFEIKWLLQNVQELQTSLIVPSKLTLIIRLEQYADQAKKGLFTTSGFPKVNKTERGAWVVDGNMGFGITALKIGVDKVIS